jgi:Family of unknown function (DUF6433)
MGMVVGIAEYLESVSKMKKKEDRIAALRKSDGFPLRTILQGAFDPRIKWLLPEGTPPYKPNELVDQEHVLIRESRKLAYFVEGGHPNLKQLKREAMFIELLENCAPADAKLLCAIKEKTLPWKNINIELVNEAFPGFIPT